MQAMITCLLLSGGNTDRGSLTRRMSDVLALLVPYRNKFNHIPPQVDVLPASLVTVTAGRLKATLSLTLHSSDETTKKKILRPTLNPETSYAVQKETQIPGENLLQYVS